MNRRSFVGLLFALVGVPLLPKAKAAKVTSTIIPKNGVPVGTLVPYIGVQPPDGWLMCDGSMVDGSHYPELFRMLPCAPYNFNFNTIPCHSHSIIDPGHSHYIQDPGHSHGPVLPSGNYIIKAK